jgi:seryl-tRNA synthetase
MLQVAFIRDNKETVLKGLAKRNFKNAEEVVNQTISADEQRSG